MHLGFRFAYSFDLSQQAHVTIIPNSVYIPLVSSSFLTNLTDNVITNDKICAAKCLNYDKCQTAVFYSNILVCSLFSEKSTIGQIVTTNSQPSSVLAMINREPLSQH